MIGRVTAIGVTVLLTGSCGGGDSGAQERLPDVEITALSSGAPMQLSDIEGPAVINLWATWCPPCRAEIPDFEAAHRARGDEVRFVGVNVGESIDRALEFVDGVGATYEQFSDPNGDAATALRATSMPTTVVIDADGVVTLRRRGPLDRAGLDDAIDEALGEP